MFGQQVMSGLATGSLYALTAVAVVVVFRNTRTINLAQGDFSMIGAFVALLLLKQFGLNYYFALALTVVGDQRTAFINPQITNQIANRFGLPLVDLWCMNHLPDGHGARPTN